MEFSTLFRKYRLRSEFETLSEFAACLAEEGYIYNESLYSHWQKGTRIPKNRPLLLAMIHLFVKRSAITSIEQANTFLDAAGQGFLTDTETAELPDALVPAQVWNVPGEVATFVGRVTEQEIVSRALRNFETVLISGQPGMGKTALALKVAHNLKDAFPDGVFWFSLESSSPISILQQMVQFLGSGSSAHLSLDTLIQRYQSLVWNRQMLLVLDSLDRSDLPPEKIKGLFPKGSHCAVLCTSSLPDNRLVSSQQTFELKPLQQQEQQELMRTVIGHFEYTSHENVLMSIAEAVNGHPLALKIIAQHIAFRKERPADMLRKLTRQEVPLSSFQYESTNLRASLKDVYGKLTSSQKQVASVVAAFDGIVSTGFVAACTGFTHEETAGTLDQLATVSVIEKAGSEDVRMHMLLSTFIQKQTTDFHFVERAAMYYTGELKRKAGQSTTARYLVMQSDTILHVISLCDAHGYTKASIQLWQEFRQYYWHTAYWKDFQQMAFILYKRAKKAGLKEEQADICLHDLSRLWYYDNDLLKAQQYAMEAFAISQEMRKKALTARARIRLAKIFLMLQDPEQGLTFLRQAEAYFKPRQDHIQLSHIYRYMSEMYLEMKQFEKVFTLLKQSVSHMDQSRQNSEKEVYHAVLESHLGVAYFLKKDYRKALSHFREGLAIAETQPLVRGTYTWLNTIGSGLSLLKLGDSKSKKVLSSGVKLMKQLGIVQTYSSINFFARALKSEISQVFGDNSES